MFSWKKLPDRLVIIAHRGASTTAPENTLAAFSQAIDAGADAIELDVRLTADNEVVVIHDSLLRRTTHGRGEVEKSTLTTLKKCSAGAWFHNKYSAERIPHLREVFDLVQGKVGINIELKQKGMRPNKVLLKETLAIIEEYHAQEYVLLSSFHHSLIRMVRSFDNNISTGLLYSPFSKLSQAHLKRLKDSDSHFFLTGKRLLRKRNIEILLQKGIKTGVYTINTEKELLKMHRFGIQCIFTDDPASMKTFVSDKIPHLGD